MGNQRNVQLALYTDILEKLGLSGSRTPFVWDIYRQEVIYDLDALQGKRNPTTLWSIYEEVLSKVISINSGKSNTLAAYGGVCKLCHWYSTCMQELNSTNDLTFIPDLGRAKRDSMLPHIKTVKELSEVDIQTLMSRGKCIISGIGSDSLIKFQTRAKLQLDKHAKPIIKKAFNFPESDIELFFDIETDPMRDVCYLHGFIERRNRDNNREKYIFFFADEAIPRAEEKAFAEAYNYIKSMWPCAIYYYSKYERTIWRSLQKKYPNVATDDEIEELFSANCSIDLYYDVVKPMTEWPTYDYSIKTLASYLGFKWRDKDPSGASSIEWYNRWVETRDFSIKQRILDYNEDDCIATRVLLDGIRNFE